MTPATLRHDASFWLLLLAALLVGACLLRPGVTLEGAHVDQVIVLDITQSMNVPDEQVDGQRVSRLDFAKHALRRALLRLPCGSKVGWAVFTEYRSLLLLAPIEVCANLDELRGALAQIDARMAWSGNSEVAKGLHSAIGIARQLPDKPSLVFVTDGHEAPPLNPHHRPAFDDKPGEVPGLIVGVGELRLSPIPKTDPQGQPLGFWRAGEVAQKDLRSQGRGASVSGEALADDDRSGSTGSMTGATPGSEHLSSLRESYLRLLAGEQGMAYLRLRSQKGLEEALLSPQLARPARVRTDIRGVLAGLAFVLLLGSYVGAGRMRSTMRRLATAGSGAP